MRHSRFGYAVVAGSVLAMTGLLGGAVRPAHAGTIILEGSDAIGLHSNIHTGAAAYRDQVWTAIGATDPRPIGVIGTGNGVIVSTTHAVTPSPTVAGLGALSGYVALYFIADAGCCTQDDSTIGAVGAAAAVSAYLAAGGTVMIQDYTGGAAWDFAVGTGGNGNANVGGFGGGFPSSLSCSDGETVTALGTTNGFTQPPAIGCWTHQGYNQAFFGPLGFTNSFFNSPTGFGIDGFSSLLSNGSTVTVTQAPEPASLALFGAALAGLGVVRRRRRI